MQTGPFPSNSTAFLEQPLFPKCWTTESLAMTKNMAFPIFFQFMFPYK